MVRSCFQLARSVTGHEQGVVVVARTVVQTRARILLPTRSCEVSPPFKCAHHDAFTKTARRQTAKGHGVHVVHLYRIIHVARIVHIGAEYRQTLAWGRGGRCLQNVFSECFYRRFLLMASRKVLRESLWKVW